MQNFVPEVSLSIYKQQQTTANNDKRECLFKSFTCNGLYINSCYLRGYEKENVGILCSRPISAHGHYLIL